ncbi:hypothetical protein HW555_003350 [Spodoptera exigua]|uniref:MADF domain-containing protein n=1 Tax=Spodoptera exigua TaxID=7107 RepID=A0A835GLK9_SPOEX|nr:hypothetical protein HW555_003350 [Spodoptera exigua]
MADCTICQPRASRKFISELFNEQLYEPVTKRNLTHVHSRTHTDRTRHCNRTMTAASCERDGCHRDVYWLLQRAKRRHITGPRVRLERRGRRHFEASVAFVRTRNDACLVATVLDEWTEEKMRPILWDQKDPFYFKKNMKPKAWQEISDKINISPDKCKHKMIILMSSFRREKAKIMHSMADSSDTSQAYKSTWFAFKDMAFLMDKDNERKRQSQNCTDEDDDEDWAISNFQNKLLRNHVGIPIPMRNRKSLAYKQDVYQKVLDLVQDDDHPTHPTPGPSQTIEERDDEIKSFLSFIGNKMKRYTDED